MEIVKITCNDSFSLTLFILPIWIKILFTATLSITVPQPHFFLNMPSTVQSFPFLLLPPRPFLLICAYDSYLSEIFTIFRGPSPDHTLWNSNTPPPPPALLFCIFLYSLLVFNVLLYIFVSALLECKTLMNRDFFPIHHCSKQWLACSRLLVKMCWRSIGW